MAHESNAPPRFDDAFRSRLFDLFRWRRDVRRFKKAMVDEDVLSALLEAANMAPSVGLSQPWRFVLVESEARRRAVQENFSKCNEEALKGYRDESAERYARLKLEGLAEAPIHLAVFCEETTDQGHGLGRRTMPEMLHYSVVASIQNLWLAARSHGVGVGWVSIIEPLAICRILEVPDNWRLVAYLCVGYPEEEHLDPELERYRWESRRCAREFLTRR